MLRRSLTMSCLLALVVTLAVGAQTYTGLFNQASVAYEGQEWPRCAELFAAAAKAATHERQVARSFFAAAACSTAAGNKEAAFGYLDKAAEKGHRDLDRAANNPQLEPLRSDPRWKAFLAGVEARHEAHRKSLNAELERLYTEDQADRTAGADKIDWEVVSKRDAARQARVQQILAEGGAKVAEDYFHAAMVFQHGSTEEDIAKAHELSLKAAELDPAHPTARWLAAASKDRLLMRQGKPQLYGTQFRKVDGKWTLWDVDPSVTDEQRAEWGVPPLEAAKKRLEVMNAPQ